jgi:hypothetical protein
VEAIVQDSPRYDPRKKYKWSEMSVQDQTQYHIMIVDEMMRLGVKPEASIPPRVPQPLFANSEVGARACSLLDGRVKEFLVGVDTKDEKAHVAEAQDAPKQDAPTPAEEPSARPPDKAPRRREAKTGDKTGEKKTDDKKARPARAARKTAERSAETERATTAGQKPEQHQEENTTMARNSKQAQTAARTKIGSFDPKAKIHVLAKGKENPRREGTGPWKRYQAILQSDGKTVETFAKNKGRTDTLARAVKEKLVKVG